MKIHKGIAFTDRARNTDNLDERKIFKRLAEEGLEWGYWFTDGMWFASIFENEKQIALALREYRKEELKWQMDHYNYSDLMIALTSITAI